jgi:hypothetical protein
MEGQFPVKFSCIIFHESPLSLCGGDISAHKDEHKHGTIFIGPLQGANTPQSKKQEGKKAGRMNEIK